MDRPTEPVRVVGASSIHALQRLVLTVVAMIVVALVKPWGAGPRMPLGEAIPGRSPTPTIPAAPRPPTELDVVASFCLEPSAWRVYTVERWSGQQVRTWTALTPIRTATSPTDPRIPVVPVVSQAVLAIGYCSPVVGPERPPAATSDRVYRLTSATIDGKVVAHAEPVSPLRIAPIERASYLGAAYAPLSGPSWADAIYIVHIEGGDYSRWFGIQVETLNPTTGTRLTS
jgi:hypothetical protein